MNEVSVKTSKSKITQAAIDQAHLLKKQFPNIKHKQIAQLLYCDGYTHKVYSVTVIAMMLKVETDEQYYELPLNKHNNKKRKNANETPDIAEAGSQVSMIDDISAHMQETDKTEAEADQINAQSEICDVNDVRKLFSEYFICKGNNGYPDTTISEKISNVAAGVACIKKSLNTTIDVLHNIFKKLDECFVSLTEQMDSILTDEISVVAEQKTTNALLRRMVAIWDDEHENNAKEET